jgi:tight adherence protein B
VRGCLVAAGAACLLAFLAPAAIGDGSLQVHIRDAKIDPSGAVTIVVQATGNAVQGDLATSNFSVSEANQPVAGLSVQPLLASQAQPVAVALLIDDSGSTKGKPHADAQAAASNFMRALPGGVQIALIAIDGSTHVASPFTSNRAILSAAIAGLPVGGETAIYDGIALASTMLSQVPGQHNIVLFTDGADTVSKTTLAGATAAAKSVKAPISSVGLTTPDSKPAVLSALSKGTGGTTISVADSGKLTAGFAQVAREIASQYLLTYSSTHSAVSAPNDLDLTVTVAAGSDSSADTVTVLNPHLASPAASAAPAGPQPAAVAHPPLRFLASRQGLYIGAAAAFAALALLAFMVLHRPRNKALLVLRRTLRLSVRPAGGVGRARESGTFASGITRRAVDLVDQVPKPQGFEQRLQVAIDQAGWPLRANEFLALQAVGAVLGGLIGIGLVGNLVIAALMAFFGFVIPRLILARRVHRRAAEFLSQLPDTLQLLSASLKAGYGLLQAIDTVTKEASAPTSTEFARVLTEARLGMPLEEALEAMAARVGGDDFRWVVMAINIQRQVGGNLATVLETVANTLREREQLRRQVKALSAEGRLSGIILFVLPIGLAAYMALVNPNYIGTLLTSWIGKAMIVTALILMGVGGLWMRKLVRFKI